MRFKLAAALLTLFLFAACSKDGAKTSDKSITITVMAAASLTDAFEEIGTLFETENPSVSVVFSFAGSQQLARQILNGAPADIFASADEAQMITSSESGRINKWAAFAQNRLAVVVPVVENPQVSSFADLAKPGLRLLIAAEEVPAGMYTQQMLALAANDPSYGERFRAAVLSNVVSKEDSVRAVFTKVALGEADAGIVYSSDTVANSDTVAENGVKVVEIPEWMNVTGSCFISVLSDSPNHQTSEAFVRFLFSDTGQSVLTKHGFLPVED